MRRRSNQTSVRGQQKAVKTWAHQNCGQVCNQPHWEVKNAATFQQAWHQRARASLLLLARRGTENHGNAWLRFKSLSPLEFSLLSARKVILRVHSSIEHLPFSKEATRCVPLSEVTTYFPCETLYLVNSTTTSQLSGAHPPQDVLEIVQLVQ